MHKRLGILICLITSTVILAIATDFTTSYAQDLNPPTTGRTTANVTSTFGTNNTASISNMNTSGENNAK
jgi:hypothetical protein